MSDYYLLSERSVTEKMVIAIMFPVTICVMTQLRADSGEAKILSNGNWGIGLNKIGVLS